jgi:hypothetical protein
MASQQHEPTDDEILAQAAAAETAPVDEPDEPIAVGARYEPSSGRVIVDLANGSTFIFPAGRCQGLEGASADQLAHVVVMPGGDGIGWPVLDAHFHVGSLVVGIFGGRTWMRQLRAALAGDAGRATSEAKATAARANGKRGGRPRKSRTVGESP